MDKCLYKGRLIYAVDVAGSGIEYETEIRKSHLLRCCDPECDGELIYRGGPIKTAHFAHKAGNINCCYNEYSSQMTDTLREIRDSLFERLKECRNGSDCNVDIDCRLSKDYRHITPIIMNGRYRFAIDIMKNNQTANVLEVMRAKYDGLGYTSLPIIVDDIYDCFNSTNDTYFTLRYWLNYSSVNSVLLFNHKESKYYLCRLDKNEYQFENHTIGSVSALDTFVHQVDLSDMSINENGFHFDYFDNLFVAWQSEKKQRLLRYIEGVKTKRKLAAERQDKRNNTFYSPVAPSHQESAEEIIRKHKEARADYEEKIYPLMKQLSKELDIGITDDEFESYFARDYNSKSRILYKTYPDRDRLKIRMKVQIEKVREKK